MKIGKYEIIEELGSGAMGTVYKAHDPRLDRFVAIKLIAKSATQDAKLVSMFEKEARSIARLSHPNIVTIFEFDYSERQPYIVMELLKGKDFSNDPRIPNLPVARKLNLVRQVCDGLAHAHEQGIIHRDIKPANIYFTENETVKITDFGIARLSSGTMTTGAVIGTPEFIAPERLSTGKTDTRSDIFSTGVVLYWLLSGNRPFFADDLHSIFYRLLQHDPPNILAEGLSEAQLAEMNRIVQKSLAKNPEHRYATAAEMSSDLKALEQAIAEGTQPVLVGSTNPASPGPGTTRPAEDQTGVRTHADRTLRLAPDGPVPPPNTTRPIAVGLALILLVAAGIFGFLKMRTGEVGTPDRTLMSAAAPEKISIGIASGGEKLDWMEKFAAQFQTTEEGKNIEVNVYPMGSREGMQAVLAGDKRIQAWAPASELEEDAFLQAWKQKYGSISPVVEQKDLALTPLVFLMWEDRANLFVKKYGAITFATLARAMRETGGWNTIAGKADWGLFKFGLSDPLRFHSGLAFLNLVAHEYYRNPARLSVEQAGDPALADLFSVFRNHGIGSGQETKQLAAQMVEKGPSSLDAIFTYEMLALQLLPKAEGRWGKLRIIYPEYNYWIDNPMYVLNVPWSTEQQQKAARAFLKYISSTPIQTELMQWSLRPTNPDVPMNTPDSPFIKLEKSGIVLEVRNALDTPPSDVLQALLTTWEQK